MSLVASLCCVSALCGGCCLKRDQPEPDMTPCDALLGSQKTAVMEQAWWVLPTCYARPALTTLLRLQDQMNVLPSRQLAGQVGVRPKQGSVVVVLDDVSQSSPS